MASVGERVEQCNRSECPKALLACERPHEAVVGVDRKVEPFGDGDRRDRGRHAMVIGTGMEDELGPMILRFGISVVGGWEVLGESEHPADLLSRACDKGGWNLVDDPALGAWVVGNLDARIGAAESG